jgi:hypothetical protein
MQTISRNTLRFGAYWMAVCLAGSSLVLAQDSPDSPAPAAPPNFQGADPNQAPPQFPNQFPNQDPNQGPPPGSGAPYAAVPPKVNLAAGTYVTVRLNQALFSDRNQVGDAFSASLVQPIIVDGVIVAQRGQTVGGRVAEAQKAGRVEGTSRLQLQLTDLTLVDGQVVPIQSQLITRNGPTSVGRDAGAIAGTTAVGAAIGAGVGWGTGAAIGAGAGAVVGTLGVLLTRGHPTIIGPEAVLTFRVEAPVTISTERAPQAFRFVDPNDYNRAPNLQSRVGPQPPPPYGSAYGPGYYGPGYGYPYYYGPGFGLYYGPGFYYGPSFYFGRGFYRGGFRR